MLKRLTRTLTAAIVAVAVLAAGPSAAAQSPQMDSSPLIKLATARFPNLTRAERAMLQFADKSNFARGEFAVAGTSADPADASNDPKDAAKWPHDRDIRAQLIRWLAIDEHAGAMVDPKGLRVLGARIAGPLDLAQVRVPFPIALLRCSISEVMSFDFADIPSLDLGGSDTAGLSGMSLNAHGFVYLGAEPRSNGAFKASGLVNLTLAKADSFIFQGGHFHFSAIPNPDNDNPALKAALFLFSLESKSDVSLCCGFESVGAVFLDESTIGGDLNCSGGRFSNPNKVALSAGTASIAGEFIAGDHPYGYGGKGGFEADGAVLLAAARIGTVDIRHARFNGNSGELHGLFAFELSARRAFVWRNVELENGATLDLSGANVGVLVDDEKSWPQPGKLMIDRFSYTGFGGNRLASPSDARSRLRWLGLQNDYYPQPYRQLAKVLRENGDEAGAVKVLIAAGDARYSQRGWPGRMLGWLLKVTIGYGHRPMLALLWALGIVLAGWAAVFIGKRAGVMRLTWPETTPPPTGNPTAGLNPLLYSLDVFVPFVNLHQEHYWWPDESCAGKVKLAGREFRLRGSSLRVYLWMQIIAGWLLSAIFIAGVTGLIRND